MRWRKHGLFYRQTSGVWRVCGMCGVKRVWGMCGLNAQTKLMDSSFTGHLLQLHEHIMTQINKMSGWPVHLSSLPSQSHLRFVGQHPTIYPFLLCVHFYGKYPVRWWVLEILRLTNTWISWSNIRKWIEMHVGTWMIRCKWQTTL